MADKNAASMDRRSQVHTEIRVPVETVMIRVVWFIFGVIEVLIAIRFVLLLLGANAGAGFVRLIYAISAIFMAPFITIFKTQTVARGAVFEWSALVAIAIYALVAWGLVQLIHAVGPRDHAQTVESVTQDEDVTARR